MPSVLGLEHEVMPTGHVLRSERKVSSEMVLGDGMQLLVMWVVEES